MDSKKSNKIREIVRLQQIIKKWKKLANASKNNSTNPTTTTTNGSTSKSMKFLKKTLSFSESSYNSIISNDVVPKGYLALCVGKELKRFIIPTEYLAHQTFGILLREAEEEFGFQQEGVLKIPCEVSAFEKILKIIIMEHKPTDYHNVFFLHDNNHEFDQFNVNGDVFTAVTGCYSSPELTPSHHAQLCR